MIAKAGACRESQGMLIINAPKKATIRIRKNFERTGYLLAWSCNNSLQTVKGFLNLGRLDVAFFYSCILPYSVFLYYIISQKRYQIEEDLGIS